MTRQLAPEVALARGITAEWVEIKGEVRAGLPLAVAKRVLTMLPPNGTAELVAAIDQIVAAWDGGDLAGAVTAARQTADFYRAAD